MTKSRKIFINNMILMRYEKKWSQEKLAEISDSCASYISEVEQGKRNISIDFLDSIADAFGVDCQEMLKTNKTIKKRVRVDSK